MDFKLKDGTGSGISARVNPRQKLEVSANILSDYELATLEGESFNINTQFVTYTGNQDHGCLYIKNNEDRDLLLQDFFVGVGTRVGGTPSEAYHLVQAFFNPTGGTLISGAVPAGIVARNAGSTTTFDLDIYKGVSGATVTTGGAVPVLYQFQGENSRTFGTVFLVLPKGSSIAVTVDTNTTGSVPIYVGFTGYLIDEDKSGL